MTLAVPVAPGAPGVPGTPAAPVGPAGPAGPAGPVAPAGPSLAHDANKIEIANIKVQLIEKSFCFMSINVLIGGKLIIK